MADLFKCPYCGNQAKPFDHLCKEAPDPLFLWFDEWQEETGKIVSRGMNLSLVRTASWTGRSDGYANLEIVWKDGSIDRFRVERSAAKRIADRVAKDKL